MNILLLLYFLMVLVSILEEAGYDHRPAIRVIWPNGITECVIAYSFLSIDDLRLIDPPDDCMKCDCCPASCEINISLARFIYDGRQIDPDLSLSLFNDGDIIHIARPYHKNSGCAWMNILSWFRSNKRMRLTRKEIFERVHWILAPRLRTFQNVRMPSILTMRAALENLVSAEYLQFDEESGTYKYNP